MGILSLLLRTVNDLFSILYVAGLDGMIWHRMSWSKCVSGSPTKRQG